MPSEFPKSTVLKPLDSYSSRKLTPQEQKRRYNLTESIINDDLRQEIRNSGEEISKIDSEIAKHQTMVDELKVKKEELQKNRYELMKRSAPYYNRVNNSQNPQPIPQTPGQEPKIPKPQLGPAFQPQPEPTEPTIQKRTEPTIPQAPAIPDLYKAIREEYGNPPATPAPQSPTIPNNVFGVNFPQGSQDGQDNKGPNPLYPTTNFKEEK